MKKLIFLLLTLPLLASPLPAPAQAEEAAQLLLNVTKLSQLKQILTDLEKGYTTLRTGYSRIENIASGNFSLHETFLDGLLQVNPPVKNYYKVAEVIRYQITLVTDYKAAYARFKSSGQFTGNEISYLEKVYSNLLQNSLQQLDELALILTAGTLRMSDEERFAVIDTIHKELEHKVHFLTAFNQEAALLSIQRSHTVREINGVQSLYGNSNPASN